MNEIKQNTETYNAIAESYSKEFDSDNSDDLFLDTFISQINNQHGKILDIGCGTGRESGYFKNKGFNVEGIDLSDKMLDIAKRNYPDINFRIHDSRKINYPKESYDAMWAGYSLFHLDKDELQNLFKKIYSTLKPGGVMGIVMQENNEYKKIVVPEPLNPEQKISFYTYPENKLREYLEEMNFNINFVSRKKPLSPAELKYTKLFIIATK